MNFISFLSVYSFLTWYFAASCTY